MPEESKLDIVIDGVVYSVTTYYAEQGDKETVSDKIVRLAQGVIIS